MRCFGFLSTDGEYAHCTREDLAGGLPQHAESQTYAHRLRGDCPCGTRHGGGAQAPAAPVAERRIVATYDYRDEGGDLLYQVVRFQPKGFVQRRPDGAGGWTWNLQGVRLVLYRLPELLEAPPGTPIHYCEGEKDADNVRALGFVATTNAMGAGKFRPEFASAFAGHPVVLHQHNDAAGVRHCAIIAAALAPVCPQVKVFLPPDVEEHGDISDWLSAGGTREKLEELLAATVPWTPAHLTAPPSRNGNGHAAPAGEPFHLTDLGNGQRFAAQHREGARYCHPWNSWLIWDGERWRRDATAEAERKAKDTVRSIYVEASACEDDTRRAAIAKWAKASEANARQQAMLAQAMSEPGIPVMPDDLDADPWLLNVRNGTLDLRTGELMPHRRDDLITKRAPVEYDPAAECPIWQRFLLRVLDCSSTLISFLQRAAGYSLTGEVREQVFFMLYGQGRNGKSTLVTTLLSLLGDYALQTPSATLMVKREGAIPNDVARLRGARFIAAMETAAGGKLDEAFMKQFTGGDVISARFLNEEFFDFKPQGKIWLSTNHRPNIEGSELAIWRRVRLIPFNVRIPEQECDPALPEKLAAERSGILAWAVRGCLDWQAEGLNAPEEVKAATQDYQQDMDTLAPFLEEHCVLQKGAQATASDLYGVYKQWAAQANERPMTQKGFGQALQNKGFVPDRTNSHRLWRGIGLRDTALGGRQGSASP